MPVHRRVLLLGVVAAMALTGCQGAVQAVTNLIANPAMDQGQFEVTRDKSLRLSWSVPAGQPADTVYTVIEHPTENPESWCNPQYPVERVTTTATSATLDMVSGHWCNFRTYGWNASYSVIARSGSTSVESARSNGCSWWRYQYTSTEYWFGCGQDTLYAIDSASY